MTKPRDHEALSFEEQPEEGEEDFAQPAGSLYITTEGAEKLRGELKHLLNSERPRVTAEVSAAAAQGDRSENAEYIYGKKRLREIDRRLYWLQKRLEKLTVVDVAEQKDTGKVYFGAKVTLVNEDDGSTSHYQLVGPDETDTKLGRISVDSPVGKALMGKRKGDTALVMRPRGEVELTITAIKYA